MSQKQFRVAFIVDPLTLLDVKKDTSIAMMCAAQSMGWDLQALTVSKLYCVGARAFGLPHSFRIHSRFFKSRDVLTLSNPTDWVHSHETDPLPLATFDAIFMRKDPPFDMNYIYATYILEQAEAEGVLVVNSPRSLRDHNEKFSIAEFSQLTPETIVAARAELLREFHEQHRDVVFKKLDGMGGTSIFRMREDDPNLNVVLETLTENQTVPIMAQRFIPEISKGDKRILIVDGKPVPYCLARIPKKGETRGNLAVGAKGVVQPLSARDLEIAETLGPVLAKRGLMFVGIDVIGDYLTEINVTSPTGIREIERDTNLDIAGDLMDAVAKKLE